MIIYLYVNLFQQCQKNDICLFRLIGRTQMSEDYSSELFNELMKRNQKNASAIASFLKAAQRRYAKKMNTPITPIVHQSKVKHNQPPLVINKNLPIIRSLESKQNSSPKFDEIKQNQFQQSQNYFCSKQRKQQIKNLFQFVRETRETKLKFQNSLKKKNENVSQSKPIPRALLHLKNIVFFGDGINKLEIRRNKSLKGSIKILPILKIEKNNNSSLHINIEGNV